jgi:transaldolase
MNTLEQLRKYSKIVADTGDIESIKKFNPVDATTNPSLILQAVKSGKYSDTLNRAIRYANSKTLDKQKQVGLALDRIIVEFGLEILKIVPGRVSTETDAKLSFDTEAIIEKAKLLISMYNDDGISNDRVLIKIASTWEGIKAAEQLEKEGIRCNMTLLFSLTQAVACAEAGVQLISPFVGRVLDWYIKAEGKKFLPHEEPGVLLVKSIYNYYKKFGHKTEIMGASFRNSGEIIELAGCDLLTISPDLMDQLHQSDKEIERKLHAGNAEKAMFDKIVTDEKKFRWALNEDAMATEKLSEGIRRFHNESVKLEELILQEITEKKEIKVTKV